MRGVDRGVPEQRYLRPAPEGVDAFAAWAVGADGRGQTLVDVERGWNPRHIDLAVHDIRLAFGEPLEQGEGHGTSVLGIACAAEHGPDFEPPRAGCTGIAPRVARIELVAIDDEGTNLAEALQVALDRPAGDIVLIEVQSRLPSPHQDLLAPVEAHPVVYELVASAVRAGVVVIEVGGNGTTGPDDGGGLTPALDMDRIVVASDDAPPAPLFDRDYRDSGAIIVSAATDDPVPRRLAYAPRGRRIDLFARAERVFCPHSVGGEKTQYRGTFSGTSAAGAIVAGAALCLQSHAVALGATLDGWQMRELLAYGGTHAADGEAIGVMPNLAAAIDRLDARLRG